MLDLKNKLEKIQKDKYRKIRDRFEKNLKTGRFAIQTSREKRRIINTLKKLEAKLGIVFNTRLKHWALAAALGFITIVTYGAPPVSHGQLFKRPHKEKERNENISENHLKNQKILAAAGDTLSFSFKELGDGIMIDQAFADIDQDGDNDIITFGYYGEYKIFQNDGSGNFTLADSSKYELGVPEGFYVNDFDNDGDYDFFISSYDYSSYEVIHTFYQNDGAGNFTPSEITFPDYPLEDTKILDVNHDGYTDFISRVDEGSNMVVGLLINNGAMDFTYQSLGFDIPDYSVGYFNNDRFPDIANTVSYYDIGDGEYYDSVYVYINTTGSFSQINKTGSGPKINIYEIKDTICRTGDNMNELIFTSSIGYNDQILYILNNDGTGQFTGTTILDTISRVKEITVADIDNDGDYDFSAFTYDFVYNPVSQDLDWGPSLNLFLQDGAGTFIPKEVSNGNEIYSFSLAIDFSDLDKDGDNDLLVNNYYFGLNTWENDGNENYSVMQKNITDPYFSMGGSLGDIDNDGDQDIITSGVGHVVRNDGNGDFTQIKNFFIEYDLVNYLTISGDMDNDGDDDIVMSSWYYNSDDDNGYIQVWSFEDDSIVKKDEILLDYDSQFNMLSLGDIDKDNFNDVAIIQNDFNNDIDFFGFYKNDGTGGINPFTNVKTFHDKSMVKLSLEDVDNNNIQDAIIASWDSLYILKNDGAGNFSGFSAFSFVNNDISTVDFAAGDIDDDGDPDIIVANEDGYDRLLVNDGNGNFSLDPREIGSYYSYRLALGDLDNDGDLDLVMSHNFDNNIIFTNDGSGNFSQAKVLEERITFYTYSILTGDIDNDGDIDIFQPTLYSGDNLWLNDLIVGPGGNHAPTNILLSLSSVNENSPLNTAVGTFTTTDTDAGDTHTYSFKTGNGLNDADNANFVIDGDILKTNSTLDYETKSSYKIYVQSNDGQGGKCAKTFIINILDVDETGIINTEEENDISIFPNPSLGKVMIKGSDKFDKIEIVNITGHTVYKNDFNGSETLSLPGGIYFVKMSGSDIVINKKLIVK